MLLPCRAVSAICTGIVWACREVVCPVSSGSPESVSEERYHSIVLQFNVCRQRRCRVVDLPTATLELLLLFAAICHGLVPLATI